MKNSISALIIAVGLLALGLCLRSGIVSFVNKDRQVVVRGLSEREVEANKVTWPIVYRVTGDNLPALYDRIEANNQQVIEYITRNGLTADDYSVDAPDVTDTEGENYYSTRPPYRYSVISVITVTSPKVDVVRQLIDRQGELMKKGIAIIAGDYRYETIYEYTDLNSIKPEMIADATMKAREAAEKFAEDSGSKVGKIMQAYQGQFSIENRDPYTPFIKRIRVVTSLTYSLED